MTFLQGARARVRALVAIGAVAILAAGVSVLAPKTLAQSGGTTATPLPALPSVKIVKGTLISPTNANAWYAAQPQVATDGLCTAYSGNPDICPGGTRPRAPEVRELARALRGDPNLIYEYVRNAIDTEFLFGTHKGSVGVIVDRSGTAFDQAQLMVDLLRESSINARFRYGTVQLTGAQFYDWTGITNAKAACDFLSTGGIPASVNSCSASATVSSVTLSHVWVEAEIGGSWRFFDPAFKVYEHTKGINDPALSGTALTGNIKTAMGFATGDVASAAGGTEATTGTTGLKRLASINQTALSNKLQSYSLGLLTRLQQPDMQGASLREVIGGRLITPAERPSGGWLQATPSNYSGSQTWTAILDPWRTKVKLYSAVTPGGQPTIVYVDANFFADEIYGRRVEVLTVPTGDPATTPTWTPHLLLDGVQLAIGADQPGALQQKITLEITANHPFAAAAAGGAADGSYGDATVSKLTDIYSSATLVIGWGSASTAMSAKWDREYAFDRPTYISVHSPLSEYQPPARGSGDSLRARIAATWLAQFSWATDIHAELANARPVVLHTIGVISQDQHMWGVPERPWEPDQMIGADPVGFETYDEVTVVDLETSFGLVSRTSDATSRLGAIHAIAATAATLEGSVIAQLVDAPDTASTAARFAWGNNPESGETPDTDAREVYSITGSTQLIRDGAAAAFVPLTTYDDGTAPVAAYNLVPSIAQPTVDIFRTRLSGSTTAYAAAGYDITVSSEASLGPGHRIGSEYARAIYQHSKTTGGASGTLFIFCSPIASRPGHTHPPIPNGLDDSIGSLWVDFGFANAQPGTQCDAPGGGLGVYEWDLGGLSLDGSSRVTRTSTVFDRFPTLQRGGAFIATKYGSGSEPVEIAHVLTRYGAPTKGGGGPTVTQASEFKPNEAGQALKDRFVDRSGALGVDLGAGQAGFASPVLASIGSGEFPYRLDRRIELRGGASKLLPFYLTESLAPVRPQDGPVSNWDIRAEFSNSAYETMGQSRAEAAVPTIVAFIAMQDVWGNLAKGARRDVIGVITAKWWSDRLLFNVVTVLQGAGAQQFVRLIDDTFVPASGGAGKLTVTGTRSVLRPAFQRQRVSGATQEESTLRGWKYSTIQIELTNPNGDKQSFEYWAGGTPSQPPPGSNPNGYLDVDHGWRLATWTFPYGVTLTMEYQLPDTSSALTGSQSSVPKRVNSSLGFGLDIPVITASSEILSDNPLAGCGTLDATNLAGETTRVTFRKPQARTIDQRPDASCRPLEVYSPSDLETPSLDYAYDSLGRVKSARDAIAIREPLERGAHQFFVAEGYRGERLDPLGGRYAVEILRSGRETRNYDELFFVSAPAIPRPPVVTKVDGRGRVTERVFPEGDKVKFTYDARDNPASLTKCPKTGCGTSDDLTVSALWHSTWNKPLSITDAMGRTTTFEYYESGNGKSQIRYAVRPSPGSGAAQPTYSFWYDSRGLVTQTTDPDGVETENTYSSAGCLTGSRMGPSGLGLWNYFACNATGDVIEAWDARGESLTKVLTQYDVMRRPTQVTAPLGVVTKTSYDDDGRPVEVQKRLEVSGVETWQVWRTGYTPTGQTHWTQDPSGDVAMIGYDALDRKVLVTAPTGEKTSWIYDAASQPVQVREGVGITCPTPRDGLACEQPRETYTYTANGQKASLTDARGNTTTFVYDGHDRLLRTVFPDASWEGSAADVGLTDDLMYNAAGNLLRFRTREGRFLVRTYDQLDRRLTEKAFRSDGTTPGYTGESWRMRDAAFTYALSGRMLSAATDQVTKSWTYDTAGRPATHNAATPSPNPTTFTFTYGWDVAGNLTSLAYPGNLTASWTYDALGRMTGASTTGAATASVTLEYDTLSRRKAINFGDGSKQLYAYEADDDVSSIAHTYPTNPTSHNVTYTWTYDASGRQVSEAISNATYLWDPGVVYETYGPANGLNQVHSITAGGITKSLGHDLNGSIISDGVWAYAYDEKRNLTLAYQGMLSSNNFEQDFFNALGVRWWSYRSIAGQPDPSRRELTDGLRPEVVWEEMATTPEGGARQVQGNRYYVLGPNPDERLIWIDATETTVVARYPHTTRRGDTIAVAKGGQAEAKFTYGPFGEAGSAAFPWRFTGQRLNGWTGLYHFKARAYSPALGRFMQPDPIGYEDGPHLYTYSGNSPFSFKDGTGLAVEPDHRQGMPFRLQVGIDAHNVLKRGGVAAGYVADVNIVGNAKFGNGRIDLGDPMRREFWELKPNSPWGIMAAQADLLFYEVSVYWRSGTDSGPKWRQASRAPSFFGPDGTWSGVGTMGGYRYIHYRRGIILYDTQLKPQHAPKPAAEMAKEFFLDINDPIGRIILPPLTGQPPSAPRPGGRKRR